MSNKFADALAAGNYTQIWVCAACAYVEQYAETAHLDDDLAESVVKRWSALDAPGTDITIGVQEHGEDCTGTDRGHCGCEQRAANGDACHVCRQVYVGEPFYGYLLVYGQG